MNSEGAGSQTTIFFTGCGFRSFLQSLGVFSLSFMIHNLLSPVVKANKFQKNNPRDLSISFVVGTSILIFAGVVGLLGVFWRKVGNTHCGNANVTLFQNKPFEILNLNRLLWICLIVVIKSPWSFSLFLKPYFAFN